MRTIEQVKMDMEAYSGKKTTKGYRKLKEELKSLKSAPKGLGDVVEDITKATGIKAIVDALPFDCGCQERKEKWNKINLESFKGLFRNKRVINELSIEDYNTLCDMFKDGMPREMNSKLQVTSLEIYNRVFNIKKPTTNCAPCLQQTIKELYNVYKMNTKQ